LASNAGKSTFIRAVSAARPKVADYPFTTLHPHLGVVRVGVDRSFVIADIPGLIEGAAKGPAGASVSQHLARTRLLLHIVDIAPVESGADPARDARSIIAELKNSTGAPPEAALAGVQQMDMLPSEEHDAVVGNVVRRLRWRGPSFRISALTSEGCRELAQSVMKFWKAATRHERGKAFRRQGRQHARYQSRRGTRLVRDCALGEPDREPAPVWQGDCCRFERRDREGMQRLGGRAARPPCTSFRPPPRSDRWARAGIRVLLPQAWPAHGAGIAHHADLADRQRYLNARSTLLTLLGLGIIP